MLTIAEAATQIRSGKLSSLELTRECLDRIEKLNPVLNAFITVTSELATEQARQADAELMTAESERDAIFNGVEIAVNEEIAAIVAAG